MSIWKKLFAGGQKPPALSNGRTSTTCQRVQTERGVFYFHHSTVYGCLCDDNGKVMRLWISDAERQKGESQTELVLGLKMYLAMGKQLGEFDFSLEIWAAYDQAAEWGILEFIAQPRPIGGFVVNFNPATFKEYLERERS